MHTPGLVHVPSNRSSGNPRGFPSGASGCPLPNRMIRVVRDFSVPAISHNSLIIVTQTSGLGRYGFSPGNRSVR